MEQKITKLNEESAQKTADVPYRTPNIELISTCPPLEDLSTSKFRILNSIFDIRFFIVLLATYVNSYSQQWIPYSVADGLSHNEITAIVEDDHNKIWVGTFEGLNRFDGRHWTSYSRANGDRLIDDYITTIMKDSEGKLWIGTGEGLVIIDPEKDLKNPANWHNYDYFNTQGGLHDTVITAILEDDNGNVWIGTDGMGICIVAPQPGVNEDPILYPANWKHAYLDSQWLNLKIVDIEKDRSGNIWLATVGGVYRFNPAEHELQGELEPVPDLKDVCCIFVDSNNNVWFGRIDQGVVRIKASDPHKIENFAYAYNTLAIEQDSDGNLWFGTYKLRDGIFVADPESDLNDADNWFHYTTDNGLVSHLISYIYRGIEGDMWIGTSGRGILKYDISWLNYSNDIIQLDFTSVVDIIENQFNYLWIGTEKNGLRIVNLDSNMLIDKQWYIFREGEKKLASDYLCSIFIDDRGFSWIGSIPDGSGNQGLNLVNPFPDPSDPDNWEWLTFTVENTESCLIDDRVNAIAQDSDGYMWFGTGKGVCSIHRNLIPDSVKNPTAWTKFDTSDGLLSNTITSIFIDNENILWLGTLKGLNRLTITANFDTNWEAVEILQDKEINAIYDDLDGNLWIGTKWYGVFKLNSGSDPNLISNWTVFTTKQGLASNNVRSIVQKRATEYWFATGSGLTRLSITGNDSIWTIFKAEDGSESISIWAAVKDSRGDLWFGAGGKGITRHRMKIKAPETFIDSKFDVITTQNVLLNFSGSDLTSPPEKLRYSYQLDNAGWSNFAPTEAIQFFGLGNGRHVFEVRAMDLDGNIDQSPARDIFYKVDSGYGGKVQFCDSMACVQLYFPPGMLDPGEAAAEITRQEAYQLTNPADVIVAYNIEFQGSAVQPVKSLTLTMSILNSEHLSPNQLAIFLSKEVSGWLGIGGRVNSVGDSLVISTAITEPGIYAIQSTGINESLETEISVQPRVFSPTGQGKGFGNLINVSFSLSKPSKATVKIYNIAGRLKRIIIEDEPLMPGINAVAWDGRDDDGNFCRSGLYVVAIEAEGEVNTKTVVVSNRYR